MTTLHNTMLIDDVNAIIDHFKKGSNQEFEELYFNNEDTYRYEVLRDIRAFNSYTTLFIVKQSNKNDNSLNNVKIYINNVKILEFSQINDKYLQLEP